jgi:phage terminase small subunit
MTRANQTDQSDAARAERFCQEYMKDSNGTQAAIRAGYSAKSASVQASRLLSRSNIKLRVAELDKELERRNMLTAERILEEYRRVGTFNPKLLFNADGSPIPFHQLPDEVAACISSIEYEETLGMSGDGKSAPVRVVKLRFWSKTSALDSAARAKGMFKDVVKLEINPIRELMEYISNNPKPLPAKP